MRVLRIAFVCAAALLPIPSLAIEDIGPAGSGEPASHTETISAQQAVREALDRATDGGYPIEALVLAGVRSSYEERAFDLLWFAGGNPRPQMRALIERLQAAERDGLQAADYALPEIASAASADPRARAEADVAFSRAVARFVTHLSSGRMRPADISQIITLKPERPELPRALALLARTEDIESAFRDHEPPHPQYRALKAALAELRATPDDANRIVIPEGALLRPGKTDARVPDLRLRLGVALEADGEPELYDAALVQAVEAFQAESGLKADGIVGPRTLAALNGVSREDDIAAVVANMERWRWMPRDLGRFHVMVNVPEFMVRVVEDGASVHETRVVVGTPENATPTFSHVMDHLVVNPYWNVPTSIVKEEMLPEIRQNPYGYLQRHGYQVYVRIGDHMLRADPGTLDWRRLDARSIRIRQAPGDLNALGRIKFMFLNQHSVYLHDTPSKSLFERDARAFSHGCVRVQEPLAFADAILPVAAPEWNSARLQELFGGKERRINLDNPIPVHLSYFTRFVDDSGELRRTEDIYGYDARMQERTGV